MGFTSWPPGPTGEDALYMFDFINKNGDIVGHQFDNGVPWIEALNNEPYPDEIMNNWKTKKGFTKEDRKIFLSIMPFNEARNGLAPWISSDGSKKLPDEWSKLPMNHEKIKLSFVNYAISAIRHFNPAFLCTGLEANMIIEKDKRLWPEYIDLQKYIYQEIKKEFPDLKILVSIEHNKFLGYGKRSRKEHLEAVQELLPYIDILGLSVYPYGGDFGKKGKIETMPADFFAEVMKLNKPLAVTESGVPSRNFKTYGIDFKFDEEYQIAFLKFLLNEAENKKFVFVINWASVDFDSLLKVFSKDVQDLAILWAYTGLEDASRRPKKSLGVWRERLQYPYQR